MTQFDRQEYLENLRVDYVMGTLTIDPDDPRTTTGLSKAEVAYVREDTADLEVCGFCHALKSRYASCCDESDLFRD